MKFISRWGKYAVMALLPFAVIACDNDPNPDPDPEPGEGIEEVKGEDFDETKDTDKSYMEETATMFLKKFNARDQQALLNLCSFFVDEYEDYDFPENFYEEDASRSMMRAFLTQSVYNYASSIYTYTFNMARFKGIYEPNRRREEWAMTGMSDDCIFRFTDNYNQNCEIKVAANTSDVWSYSRRIDGDVYILEVPKKLTLTITRGGETLVNAIVESSYMENAKLDLKLSASVMNLSVKSTTTGTNSSIVEEMEFGVDGEMLVKASSTVNGSNLCNIDKWEDNLDYYEDEALSRMVTNAYASTKIMGRVTVDGKVNNVSDFIEYYDYWTCIHESTNPESDAKNAARKLRSAVEANVKYAGSNKVRATLDWTTEMETYSWYGYYDEDWWVTPVIVFASDNSQYDFESYFANGRFFKVEDLFDNIVDQYDRYF